MAQIEELLELLNTLILYSVDNTITIEKTTLQSVVTCLQFSQAKVALLQTQTRLFHDALERKNLRQHFELALVQNPLFKDDEDDDFDSDQQLVHGKLIETTPDSRAEKDQLPLSKPIIKPLGRNQAQRAHNQYQI
jgi:hypothetical protein